MACPSASFHARTDTGFSCTSGRTARAASRKSSAECRRHCSRCRRAGRAGKAGRGRPALRADQRRQGPFDDLERRTIDRLEIATRAANCGSRRDGADGPGKRSGGDPSNSLTGGPRDRRRIEHHLGNRPAVDVHFLETFAAGLEVDHDRRKHAGDRGRCQQDPGRSVRRGADCCWRRWRPCSTGRPLGCRGWSSLRSAGGPCRCIHGQSRQRNPA